MQDDKNQQQDQALEASAAVTHISGDQAEKPASPDYGEKMRDAVASREKEVVVLNEGRDCSEDEILTQ